MEIIADFNGNWTCEEKQICFSYGYKCITLCKRENVNQQNSDLDANKVVT